MGVVRPGRQQEACLSAPGTIAVAVHGMCPARHIRRGVRGRTSARALCVEIGAGACVGARLRVRSVWR